MKRSLHIIALILFLCISLSAVHIFTDLPGDTGILVEKKYAGWHGVLRLWLCSRWSCGASFQTWINRCASLFEKAHPGVYVECTAVPELAMQTLASSGMAVPEIILFSPGVVSDTSLLREITAGTHSYALPVCMGGYIWVNNKALGSDIADTAFHLPDDAGRSFSLAALSLEQDPSGIELSDPGIDLGLPASARQNTADLQDFIDGSLPALLISQKELAHLIRLRDAGKGPDWACTPTGGFMIADQLLLAALPHTDADDGRDALAEEFIHHLLAEECQSLLRDIGAFSPVGRILYSPTSPYAPMETMVTGLDCIAPDFFSEYPSDGFQAIVRNRLFQTAQ